MKALRIALVVSLSANLYFLVHGLDRGSALGDCLDEQERQHRRSLLAADAASAGWRSRSLDDIKAYARDAVGRRALFVESRGDVLQVEDLSFRLVDGRVQAVYLSGEESGRDSQAPSGQPDQRP